MRRSRRRTGSEAAARRRANSASRTSRPAAWHSPAACAAIASSYAPSAGSNACGASADPGDRRLGVGPRAGPGAVAVAVQVDRVGDPEHARRPLPRGRLIGPRDRPVRGRHARPGGDRHQGDVVGRARERPGDPRLQRDPARGRSGPPGPSTPLANSSTRSAVAQEGPSTVDRHPDLLAELRGQVAHAEAIVDAHPGQQPQADQGPAGLQGPARRVDVEPRRVVVAAGDVGAALADDVAGDVVAVARADGRRSARRDSSGPSSRGPAASGRTASPPS